MKFRVKTNVPVSSTRQAGLSVGQSHSGTLGPLRPRGQVNIFKRKYFLTLFPKQEAGAHFFVSNLGLFLPACLAHTSCFMFFFFFLILSFTKFPFLFLLENTIVLPFSATAAKATRGASGGMSNMLSFEG